MLEVYNKRKKEGLIADAYPIHQEQKVILKIIHGDVTFDQVVRCKHAEQRRSKALSRIREREGEDGDSQCSCSHNNTNSSDSDIFNDGRSQSYDADDKKA